MPPESSPISPSEVIKEKFEVEKLKLEVAKLRREATLPRQDREP